MTNGESCVVLTVENDRSIARSLIQAAEREPKHVLSVRNTRDALVALRSVRLHVVVIDADTDALEIPMLLKAIDDGTPRSRLRPIVLAGNDLDLPAGVVRGEVTLLRKPITSARLAALVDAECAVARLRHQDIKT